MTTANTVTISTRHGPVLGERRADTDHFFAIPYAAPPVGDLRFAPPERPTAWTTPLDTRAPGAIPPQRPSRLARVLGDYDLPQSEDCLSINVVCPSADTAARRPVLVWLYGGAFVSGGHSIAWYDGTPYAEKHGLVFVGVNYRLGALGFLRLAGLCEGNMALHDQLAALNWVQENIGAFGGDPSNVTLMGQSAGAMSIFALMASGRARGHFHRAIMQSGRYGSLGDVDDAEHTGQVMAKEAGGASALRAIEVDAVLAHQGKAIAGSARFGRTTTPFRPIADGNFLPRDPEAVLDAFVQAAGEIEIMLGWTRDEMRAFFAGLDTIEEAPREAVDAALAEEWESAWAEGQPFIAGRGPGADNAARLDLGLNEAMFAGSTVDLAERLGARGGAGAWLYRFDWSAPGNPFGACHCIELPFIFDNASRWRPPMLEGSELGQVDALSRVLQCTWARFATCGDPNHPDLPSWPRYQPEHGRWTLRVDQIIEVVGDLGGVGLPGRPRPARYHTQA